MTATKVLPEKEKYPLVSQTKSHIYELEKQFQEVRYKEELKLQTRGTLLQQPPSEESNRRRHEVESEIGNLQAQKKHLTDWIADLTDKTLPQVEAEAKETETQLKNAQENRKTIKGEISDLDKKINESAKPLIDLIEQRQTIIHALVNVGDEIQTLTAKLRWHPPEQAFPPCEPEMLRRFRELLDPRRKRF